MEKDLTSPSIRRNSKNRYGLGTAFIIDTLRKVLEMFPTKREQCLEMMFFLLFLAGEIQVPMVCCLVNGSNTAQLIFKTTLKCCSYEKTLRHPAICSLIKTDPSKVAYYT